MRISINIEQIDNGFTLSMFDADGAAEFDQNIFVESLAKALKTINDWADNIVERNATGDI